MESKWNQELCIALGFSSNIIKIISKKTFEGVAELKGHTERVLDLAVSPCNKLMVSGSPDNSIRFWRL